MGTACSPQHSTGSATVTLTPCARGRLRTVRTVESGFYHGGRPKEDMRGAAGVILGLQMLSILRAASAFSLPSVRAAGRHAARAFADSPCFCARRPLDIAGAPRASLRTGLRLAADNTGAFDDKNITVGPDGINFDEVGAVGNLRMGGQGFKAPQQKADPDVGVNFKVKRKEQLANEIDQNTAKQKNAGSAYNLDNLVDFPCLFQLKVLGHRQGEFVEDILDLIGNTLGERPPHAIDYNDFMVLLLCCWFLTSHLSPFSSSASAGINGRELKHSHRDKGKWRSITVAVPVDSAEQL